MAKATNDKATDVDIWAGSIEEVKARVKAVLDRDIAAQINEADEAEECDPGVGGDACNHAASMIKKIRRELFGA